MTVELSSDTVLNPKQIVFFFMAATVVAVAVFLCGVVAGRGLPIGGGMMASAPASGSLAVDTLPPATVSSPRSEPSAAASESAELTYYWRLDGRAPRPERLRPASTTQSPDVPGAAWVFATGEEESVPDPLERRDRVVVRKARDEAETQLSTPPAGVNAARAQEGFWVQVTALQSQAPARTVAAHLSAKGYPAAVVMPHPDAPVAHFKVWVGPYEARAEAARVMVRLETEEQYRPFVTR